MGNNNCKWGGVEAKMKKTFMSEVREFFLFFHEYRQDDDAGMCVSSS